MALSDYLASKYLSADAKPAKKRRRKDTAKTNSLTIEEDDSNDWTRPAQNGSDDNDAPVLVGGAALAGGLNKAAKKSTWIKVGVAPPTDSDQAAADAILADAQAESARRAVEDDDAPAIVEVDGVPAMASGAAAGLQTAEQVTAALRRKEKAERKAMKDAGLDPDGKAQETIYRDASGRVINVAMKRAEMRAKAEEEERKKAEELESRKGDVQRREREERRLELMEAKIMPVARHADDRQLNDELKERERWNDPMAPMLAAKKTNGVKGTKGKGEGNTYQGAAEPNRYGIRPGWRWDGVDRGNGFERKWFAVRAAGKDRQDLEYAWQMDE